MRFTKYRLRLLATVLLLQETGSALGRVGVSERTETLRTPCCSRPGLAGAGYLQSSRGFESTRAIATESHFTPPPPPSTPDSESARAHNRCANSLQCLRQWTKGLTVWGVEKRSWRETSGEWPNSLPTAPFPNISLCVFYFLLGMRPKASCMLGKHSTSALRL